MSKVARFNHHSQDRSTQKYHFTWEGDWRGHVVADGEERDAVRAVPDEAEEGFYVVDGGGVEQIGNSLGKCSRRRENHLPRYSAEMISSRRPFHSPHSLRRRRRRSLIVGQIRVRRCELKLKV